MSKSLAEDLPGGSGTKALRVWLKSSGYARRLLLGADGDPWAEGAAKYLSFFGQARGLLRADVAVVDLGDMFRSWIARHPALIVEMDAKKRATYPLRRMLEHDGPRRVAWMRWPRRLVPICKARSRWFWQCPRRAHGWPRRS